MVRSLSNRFVSCSYMFGSAFLPATGGLFLGDDAAAALSDERGRFWVSQDQRHTCPNATPLPDRFPSVGRGRRRVRLGPPFSSWRGARRMGPHSSGRRFPIGGILAGAPANPTCPSEPPRGGVLGNGHISPARPRCG